ncbi:EAL domain-containing protein [Paraburkholderia kururiensis]|uniref:EAL domain-containing response regulator n=1 Tax=Paraburkholderia kururiensis TaxID=984307 RepID=A0ABZ0WJC7_9BURK|nr:EAL domain-containing response regulator [Paraburkholderia kururiensis]WQD77434.1 EAL domain-containing response regulator [Paraburkholderia kururiensis]
MIDAHASERESAVLIIEDDPVQRGIMEAMVRKLGMRGLPAATVSEARAHLQNDDVRMVLLDLRLQDGTSLDVLHSLGNDTVPRSVILASGCDERTRNAVSRIAEARGVHVAGSLRKPICEDSLAALLRAGRGAVAVRQPAADEPCDPDDVTFALAGGRIVPYFQPQVSLSTGRVVGVEALARWQSDAHSTIGPERFVSVIESMGQARAFTALMLKASLAACARWRRRFPEVSVAVNVPPSLVDAAFGDLVRSCLHEYAVPPSALVLELTEGSPLSDSVAVGNVLTGLRIDGVGLAIDDFGTGYSSMLSLLRIPFSEMKLDRAFVGCALHDADSARILSALIAMSRDMGVTTVAEGIECVEVRDRLAAYGCSTGQGWLWSAALKEAALHAWLDDAAQAGCAPTVASTVQH